MILELFQLAIALRHWGKKAAVDNGTNIESKSLQRKMLLVC